MRRGLGIALVLALAAGAAPAAGGPGEVDGQGPTAVIERTADEVIAILRDEGLSRDQRKERIETIAYERFDFTTMSRLVLARNWRRLSPEQQEEFEREFKEYLALSYGDRIDRYEQERVEIVGQRQEPRGDVTVKTRIVGGEYEGADVDYRLRERGGQWRVIDVIIEGISLVSNYRDQFQEVMARGGPEHLLDALREKNAQEAGGRS